MKSRRLRFVAGALLITLSSGCTNIKDDQTRTRAEGGLAGISKTAAPATST